MTAKVATCLGHLEWLDTNRPILFVSCHPRGPRQDITNAIPDVFTDKTFFSIFHYFLQLPMTDGFKPLNLKSWVNFSSKCASVVALGWHDTKRINPISAIPPKMAKASSYYCCLGHCSRETTTYFSFIILSCSARSIWILNLEHWIMSQLFYQLYF